jgi:hypothetical protein
MAIPGAERCPLVLGIRLHERTPDVCSVVGTLKVTKEGTEPRDVDMLNTRVTARERGR